MRMEPACPMSPGKEKEDADAVCKESCALANSNSCFWNILHPCMLIFYFFFLSNVGYKVRLKC